MARKLGYTLPELRVHDRSMKIATARSLVMTALRRRGFSYPVIGAVVGRDHSTVVHAVKSAEIRAAFDAKAAA